MDTFDIGKIFEIGVYICAAAMIIPVIAWAGYSFYRGNRMRSVYVRAAKSWPSTSGVVLVSTIKRVSSGRHQNSYTNYPDILYKYEVNGVSYENRVVKAGEQFLSVMAPDQAEATAARYLAGASVTVYYDPANPKESALER